MSYNTGTLSASVNAAKELMDTVQTIIDAHAGWQFVEQVAGTTTTTKRVDIYKCLGSVNSFGTDFFMAITRNTDSGNCQVLLAEQYDGTLKKFTNGLAYSTVAVAVNADGTHANSVAKHVANESTNPVSTAAFLTGPSSPSSASNPTGAAIAPSTPWFLSVTNDAVIISCGIFQVYIGVYDSSYSLVLDPFPIIACHLHPNTSLQSAYNPTFGTVMAGNSGFTRDIGGASASMQFPGGGGIDKGLVQGLGTSTIAIQKDPISGLWNAARVVVTSSTRRAVRRGLLKSHVLTIPMAEVTEGVGDTITIDGVVYTCFLVPNTSIFSTSFVDSIWVSQAA